MAREFVQLNLGDVTAIFSGGTNTLRCCIIFEILFYKHGFPVNIQKQLIQHSMNGVVQSFDAQEFREGSPLPRSYSVTRK